MKSPKARPPATPAALPSDPWQSPPDHASDQALAFYNAVMSTYNIRDLDGRMTLHAIIRCFDRAERAAALIAEHGELVVGQGGALKPNPACAVERDARAQMMQALKHLDIGVGPPKARPGKPMGPGR